MIEENGVWVIIKEIVKIVVYVFLIVGFFWMLLFQLFWILLGLMKSMFLIGDFLFVNKMVYGYFYVFCLLILGISIDVEFFCGVFKGKGCLFGFELECGDVVVFCYFVMGEDYIKCLIGLFGDMVEMCDGCLILNGIFVEVEVDGFFIEDFVLQGFQWCQFVCLIVENG